MIYYEGIILCEGYEQSQHFLIGHTITSNNNADEYAGLEGVITEIRTDEDRETKNECDEIHCTFVIPNEPSLIKELEKRFSNIYCKIMTIKDIAMSDVIMSADMLTQCV